MADVSSADWNGRSSLSTRANEEMPFPSARTSHIESRTNENKRRSTSETSLERSIQSNNGVNSSYNKLPSSSQTSLPRPNTVATETFQKVSHLHAQYTKALSSILRGTASIPPSIFGETLPMEHTACNISRNCILLPDAQNRLYGGAQYHRVLREMQFLVLTSPWMRITEEEATLLMGMGEMNDSPDMLRNVVRFCSYKTTQSFMPILMEVGKRCRYILKRTFCAMEYSILLKEGLEKDENMRMEVRRIFEEFVDKKAEMTVEKCWEELEAMVKFWSWDLEQCGGSSFWRDLGEKRDVEIVGLPNIESDKSEASKNTDDRNNQIPKKLIRGGESTKIARKGSSVVEYIDHDTSIERTESEDEGDLVGGVMNRGHNHYYDYEFFQNYVSSRQHSNQLQTDNFIYQVMNEAFSKHGQTKTKNAMESLMNYITRRWKMDFARLVATKFNSYFLFSFHEEFGQYLRRELDKYSYEESLR